jgi:hypothetical protein
MRILGCCAVVALLVLGISSQLQAEKRPSWVAAIESRSGMSRLDLSDDLATITLPPAFPGWDCYVGDTQPAPFGGFIKNITCGGRWGFVDGFVLCSSKARKANTVIRLRQPITGTKAEWAAAEKVTISVSCSY